MKTIYHQSVANTLNNRIVFTSEIRVRLVQRVGGDEMVVAAARVSTSGEEALKYANPECAEENYGLIKYLMTHRHGSVFEHSSMTFFVHAPIFVWREWHRHRIGFSYNETSGRYSQLEPIFWIPRQSRKMIPAVDHTSARPKFNEVSDEDYQWFVQDLKDGYFDAYNRYEERLKRGFAKEVARVGLPVAIYSSCWVTCNPRSLMAFLSLRTHDQNALFISYPQIEIEEAARVCEQILAEYWPLTYKAFIACKRVGP